VSKCQPATALAATASGACHTIAVSSPPPTTQAAIAASVDGRAAYIFGGSTAAGVVGDLYVLDTSGFFFSSPLLSEMNNTALGAPAAMGPVTPVFAPAGVLSLPAGWGGAGRCCAAADANGDAGCERSLLPELAYLVGGMGSSDAAGLKGCGGW
jgi:hypothetical protein